MLQFYFNLSPNPMKVALFLEEAGIAYEPKPVNTRAGEQFSQALLAVNPNAKVPAIVDDGKAVFDSTAILLYLAEKSGRFLGAPEARGELLSWLLFVASGVGPFSGQAVHFKHFAPEKLPYAHDRYQYEARRHYGVLEERLATHAWIAADAYTIVDMSAWGWARMVPFILGDDAWAAFPHLKRWFDAVSARPAAQKVQTMKDRFVFAPVSDEVARANSFKHWKPQAAA